MRILCTVVRAIGVFLGLFLVAMVFAGIFGSMPDSDDIPRSSAERLASGLPTLIFGILLLLPQTLFLRGKRHLFLMFCYVVLILTALTLAILGIVDYYTDGKHWLIIPTNLILLAVPISNAFVLWYLKRHPRAPPDNLVEAKSLRDST